MQMIGDLNGGSMISVFSERPMSVLALILFLRRPAGDELHALDYDIPASVFHQEMDMVGCHHVVQYGETEPLLCFKDPMQVPAPIARKL
jgi:hypothetical protein